MILGVVVIIIQAFILVNAELLFPGQGAKIQEEMTIYLIIQLLAISTIFTITTRNCTSIDEVFTSGLGEFAYFAAGLAITAVIAMQFIPASVASLAQIIQISAPIMTVVLVVYAFVKAFTEEVFFRVFLDERIGMILQVILFGLFHLAVLSIGQPSIIALLSSVIFLMFLGAIWTLMKRKISFMFALGSHVGWNLVALGIIHL